MKILSRKDFLNIENKVLYTSCIPWSFDGGLSVKLETIFDSDNENEKEPIDWHLNKIQHWLENADNSNGYYNILDEAFHRGTSFHYDTDIQSRDGMYDEREVFFVYEKEDVQRLIDKLQKVLKEYE